MVVRPTLLALAVEAQQTAHALASPDSRRYLLCAAQRLSVAASPQQLPWWADGVDGRPRPILGGEIAPGTTTARNVKDTVEHATHRHRERPTVGFSGRNQGGQQGPLVVAEVAGIEYDTLEQP